TIDGQKVVTTEDILPSQLYAEAVKAYLAKWHPDAYEKEQKGVDAELESDSFGTNGVATDTKAVTEKFIHPGRGGFDKMGVLQEAVHIVLELRRTTSKDGELVALESRLKEFCQKLRRKIELSEQAERRETGKQAVVRVIREFFIRHKEAAAVFDVELLIGRLDREAELLGEDGAALSDCLRRLMGKVQKIRASNQQRLTGDDWQRWRSWILEIRKNPLEVDIDNLREAPTEAEVSTKMSGKRIDKPHQTGESELEPEKPTKAKKPKNVIVPDAVKGD
ncbi:MAG: hypothetical protein IID46_11835, partial [Planctomycetes bacterium]|nr:hypothetical protein [Planctomycetota bacterium]